MALASTARGTATSNSSGTNNLTIAPSGNFAATSLPVLVVAYDNSGTNGADPFGTGSVTDSLGNVWISRHATLRDPGAASAGTTLRIFTCAMQFPLTTGTTITFTTQTATTAKVCALWEITAGAGNTAVYLATGTGAGGASTTPSVTTSSITSGDLVVGAVAYEYGQAPAASDTDSTNGSWSTRQNTNIGSTTSGQSVCTQTKLTTGTGTQTYNPTYTTSSDWADGWISVDEVSATQSITLGLLDAGPALYAPSVTPVVCYYDAVIADSPVAYWRLNEASGDALDDIGSSDGTYQGGFTRSQTGAVAGDDAVLLNGTTGYILVAATAALNAIVDTFTLEAWVKRTSTGSGEPEILSKGSGSFFLDFTPSDLIEVAHEGTAIIATSTVGVTDTTTWHHIVWTKSGATTKVYLDGSDVTGTVTDSTLAGNTSALNIGRNVSAAGENLPGYIDEVAIYDTALAAGRVQAHYDARTISCGAAAQTLTLGLLDAGSALYAPTLAPQPVTVTLGLLTSTSALYAPTLAAKNTITIGLLTSTSSLFAPTILPQPVTVTLGVIDAGPALYAPTLANKYTITLGLLDASGAVYAPNVSQVVTLGLLTSTSALYSPTLAPQPVTVTLGLIDGANDLYAPTVVGSGPGTQTVTLGLLDSGPALYAPTVLPQPVTITLGALDASNALYAPTITPAPVTVTLGLLDASRAVYAPTIIPGAAALALGLIDAGATTYAPTLLPQAVAISLGLLDGANALYPPALTFGLAVSGIIGPTGIAYDTARAGIGIVTHSSGTGQDQVPDDALAAGTRSTGTAVITKSTGTGSS